MQTHEFALFHNELGEFDRKEHCLPYWRNRVQHNIRNTLTVRLHPYPVQLFQFRLEVARGSCRSLGQKRHTRYSSVCERVCEHPGKQLLATAHDSSHWLEVEPEST